MKPVGSDGKFANHHEDSLKFLADYYHYLSDSLSGHEKYSLAVSYKLKELNLRFHFNEMEKTAKCGERLGILYYHLGNYHKSLRCYDKVIKYYEAKNDVLALAAVKTNQANVFTRLGNHQQAINEMRFVEEVYAKDTTKFVVQLIGLYTNLGLAHAEKSQLDSAEYYYHLAQETNKKVEIKIYEAVLKNNLGDVFFKKGDIHQAEQYYLKALEQAKQLNYVQLIATAQLNMGRLRQKQGDFKTSIKYLLQALENYRSIESLYFLAETNLELSKSYEQINNPSKSLYYLKEHIYLEDSLKGDETLKRISDLEMEVVLQKEKRKLSLVKKEKELAEARTEHQRTYLYLMTGLIVLGLLLALVIIRTLKVSLEKNRLKSRSLKEREELLRKELSFKRKEIENFSAYILEKNQILLNLRDKLKEIKNENPDSNTVYEALLSINHSLQVDKDRKELELKIDQAHQEFILRLTDQFPKLTKTEQRLSSLIMLELSTKDISVIMNINPESVKKARNRLRKKLGIDASDNLVEFLKKI
ncbi:MAG: tetratricopeptide repeat protein [Crocinitomicaceae bacterium]|nr:tetratricopeptide repeat protein [Crocinitomicaceae bacterium]